jgi:hypothetical protein
MMPHAKTDSKMQKKESLFAVNEIAEMKNCEKCLLFEGRKKKDIYLWAANIARGPSVKFEVILSQQFYILKDLPAFAWLVLVLCTGNSRDAPDTGFAGYPAGRMSG